MLEKRIGLVFLITGIQGHSGGLVKPLARLVVEFAKIPSFYKNRHCRNPEIARNLEWFYNQYQGLSAWRPVSGP